MSGHALNAWHDLDARDTLTRIETILAPVHALAAPAPWDAGPDALTDFARRRSLALARARAAAVTSFGPDAAGLEVFRPLFYPVADRFPALSSSAQIAIHEAETSALAGLRAGADGDIYAGVIRAIESAVGPDAAYAYSLRQGPAARALRASGLALTEQEFRRCFDALNSLESATLERQTFLDARHELRAALGPTRFAKLWSYSDPRYAELRRLTEAHGISAEKTDSAYIVLNDMQDELLAIAETVAPDDTRIRELYMAQKRRLGDVLGAEIAEDVLRGLSVWAARAP
jgi:hypothetical protein